MDADLRKLVAPLFDALPHPALVADWAGNILLRNAAARKFFGDAVSIELALGSADGAFRWAAEQAALREPPGRLVRRGLRLAGREGRQVLADVHLSRIAAGEAGDADAQVLVLIEDISGRVSVERRLAAAERMTAVRTLAAKIAHELNNPLDGTLRYIGLAQRVAGEKAEKYLTGARGGLVRMAEIIRSLRQRGGWQASGERESVQRVLDDAVASMQPRAQAAGVSILCDFSENVTGVVDGSVFQVFCNVIKNALDAMPRGGLLTVTLREADGGCVIRFTDTGIGLSEEEAEKIFEPFYTTKAAGEGSGLGLSICREIMARLGGAISAAPGGMGGAVVMVNLPVQQKAAGR